MKWIIVILVFVGLQASSQLMYKTSYRYEADLLVYITDAPYEADLWVYESSYYTAKGTNCGLWCFVDTEGDAEQRVYFTSKYSADLVIYYVDTKAEAGRKKKSSSKHDEEEEDNEYED